MFQRLRKQVETLWSKFAPKQQMLDLDAEPEDLEYAQETAQSIASRRSFYDSDKPDGLSSAQLSLDPDPDVSPEPLAALPATPLRYTQPIIAPIPEVSELYADDPEVHSPRPAQPPDPSLAEPEAPLETPLPGSPPLDLDYDFDPESMSTPQEAPDVDHWLDLAPDAQEFSPSAKRDDVGTVVVEGILDPQAYAQNLAIELVLRHGWEPHHVELMTAVFEAYSNFSGAESLIERLVEEGARPEEFPLAMVTRGIWTSYPEFSYIPENYQFYSPEMNWSLALEVVRQVGHNADPCEIEAYLVRVYEDWYSRPSLISRHGSFQGYLKQKYFPSSRFGGDDESHAINFDIGRDYALTTATQIAGRIVGERIL